MLRASLLILFFILILMVSVSASGRESLVSHFSEAAATSYQGASDYRGNLESKPQEKWTDLELEEYLSSTLWAVYNAMVAYELSSNRIAEGTNDLISAGFLPGVPGNPFQDWKPIQILEPGNGFSPGDLVILLPGMEHYSIVGSFDSFDLRPMSFELGIYGPNVEFAALGEANPGPHNDEWAVVPEGTLYMLGIHKEPASVTAEKIQRRIDESKKGRNETVEEAP